MVSEDTGTAEDVAPYRAGMVIVPSTNLVEVLQCVAAGGWVGVVQRLTVRHCAGTTWTDLFYGKP